MHPTPDDNCRARADADQHQHRNRADPRIAPPERALRRRSRRVNRAGRPSRHPKQTAAPPSPVADRAGAAERLSAAARSKPTKPGRRNNAGKRCRRHPCHRRGRRTRCRWPGSSTNRGELPGRTDPGRGRATGRPARARQNRRRALVEVPAPSSEAVLETTCLASAHQRAFLGTDAIARHSCFRVRDGRLRHASLSRDLRGYRGRTRFACACARQGCDLSGFPSGRQARVATSLASSLDHARLSSGGRACGTTLTSARAGEAAAPAIRAKLVCARRRRATPATTRAGPRQPWSSDSGLTARRLTRPCEQGYWSARE